MTRPLAGWLGLLVGLVNVLDGEDGQVTVVTEIAQRYPRAGLERELVDGVLAHVEGDGHTEERAAGEPVLLDDAGKPCLSTKSPIARCVAETYPL